MGASRALIVPIQRCGRLTHFARFRYATSKGSMVKSTICRPADGVPWVTAHGQPERPTVSTTGWLRGGAPAGAGSKFLGRQCYRTDFYRSFDPDHLRGTWTNTIRYRSAFSVSDV